MTPSELDKLLGRLALLKSHGGIALQQEINDIKNKLNDAVAQRPTPTVNVQTIGNRYLSLLSEKDFATQTTLLALLAKIIAAPSTEEKQDMLLAELQLKADLTETQPVSLNSPIQTSSISRFYNIRGQRYISTTGLIQQTLNVTGEALALLINPIGSGQVFMFDKAEFGSTSNCRFSMYGGGTTPLIGTPTARPIGRTDGGTSTSVMELYIGGNVSPQFSVSGGGFVAGTLRKVSAMLSYYTYQLLKMDGTIVLQPGQQVYWVVDETPGGGAGDFYTFIDFEWVEIPIANWTAMVTALQSKSEY